MKIREAIFFSIFPRKFMDDTRKAISLSPPQTFVAGKLGDNTIKKTNSKKDFKVFFF